MKRFSSAAIILLLAGSMLTTGCETPGRTSLLGAGVGAAVAGATGHSLLRGAAIGAGAGYVAGRLARHERRRGYEEGYYEGRGRVPYGRRLGEGFARSPHYPNNVIDVSGIPRGARVVDPSTGRTFINP